MPLGGLRSRLLLLVLAPLVPVLVVAFLSARQTREHSLEDGRANVQSLARLAASWVEQRVEATRQLAAGLAREPGVRAGDPRCERLLRAELRRAPAYENLVVADAAGRIACAARPPAPGGASVATVGWFREARATGRPAASGDFSGVTDRRPALVVGVPLRDPDGRFAGVAGVAVDLRVLNRLARSIELPPQASLLVLGRGGEVLVRSPDAEGFTGRRFPRSEAARAARSGTRLAELDGLDGVRRIYGFAPASGGRRDAIVVATGISRHEVARRADRTLRDTVLALAVVAAVALIAVLLAGNFLVARPTNLEARQAELDRSARDRQRLLGELLAAEEEERKRIAGDIHDDSIQALAALLLRLEMLESRLEDDDHKRRLGEAREAAREAISRLRHLVFKLSPPALETAGLVPVLTGYLEEISRVGGPQTSLRSTLEADPSPEPRALVYRIAVEAINNAASHAGGESIDVTLEPLDGGVRVQVRDDGHGFDVGQAVVPGHIGLRSMHDRAESAGGWWRVDSAPGRGSTVEFFVPDRPSG